MLVRGTGYKAGGVGPRPFNAQQAIGFGPEKLTSYEIGLKTDLFDRKVRFNTAVFYNDFKDAQLVLLSCPQFGGPGPCALPQNAGDAKVSGVEAEIIGATLSRACSSIWPDRICTGTGNASTPRWWAGERARCSSDASVIDLLSATPIGFIKEQAHVGIQYEIHLGSGGTLTPRFDATYQGPQTGSNLAAAAGSPVRHLRSGGRLHGGQRPPRVAQREEGSDGDARSHEPHQQVLLLLEVRPDRGRRRNLSPAQPGRRSPGRSPSRSRSAALRRRRRPRRRRLRCPRPCRRARTARRCWRRRPARSRRRRPRSRCLRPPRQRPSANAAEHYQVRCTGKGGLARPPFSMRGTAPRAWCASPHARAIRAGHSGSAGTTMRPTRAARQTRRGR